MRWFALLCLITIFGGVSAHNHIKSSVRERIHIRLNDLPVAPNKLLNPHYISNVQSVGGARISGIATPTRNSVVTKSYDKYHVTPVYDNNQNNGHLGLTGVFTSSESSTAVFNPDDSLINRILFLAHEEAERVISKTGPRASSESSESSSSISESSVHSIFSSSSESSVHSSYSPSSSESSSESSSSDPVGRLIKHIDRSVVAIVNALVTPASSSSASSASSSSSQQMKK